MNGGHQAFHHAVLFLQHGGHRRQAVGGARSGRNHGFAAVENIFVHAKHHGFHVAAGGGNHHFAGAGFDVFFRFFFRGEKAGAFEHHVHTQFAPGQGFRIGIGKHFDFLAVHHNSVVFQLGSALKAALGGVVFKQVQQHVGRSEVVYRHHFEAFGFDDLAQCQAADAAETINRNFNAHILLLEIFRNNDKFQMAAFYHEIKLLPNTTYCKQQKSDLTQAMPAC